MHKILLIGLGRLGARYLEGLANYSGALQIYAVDPEIEARDLASRLYYSNESYQDLHKLYILEEVSEKIPVNIDIAIIATTADIRTKLTELVASRCDVRFWILEKLLAQSVQDLDRIAASIKNSERAWVNIPRRAMKWHQELEALTRREKPFLMTVDGVAWDLATNSIHMIDLAQQLSGETVVGINCDELDAKWHQSRRKGFYEIGGNLQIKLSRSSVLLLKSRGLQNDSKYTETRLIQPSITLKFDDGYKIDIDEGSGNASDSTGLNISGNIEFMSAMIPFLVADILENQKCSLPLFSGTLKMHQLLLNATLSHWNNSNNCNENYIPIT